MPTPTEESIILEIMEMESGIDLSDPDTIDLTRSGYIDDPDDAGGVTSIWGWTARALKDHGYHKHPGELTFNEAYALYARYYYIRSGAQRVLPHHPWLARAMCNFGVHAGYRTAGRYLQVILNLHNNRGKLWDDLKEDGLVGGATIRVLMAYLARRKANGGEDVIMSDYLIKIGAHYQGIMIARESQEKYAYGWLSRVKDLMKEYFVYIANK